MNTPQPPSDDWIDRQLGDVPVPASLLGKLVNVTKEMGHDDESLDRWLNEVALPAGWQQRWQGIAQQPIRRTNYRELAAAAALFMAVSICYFGAMSGIVLSALDNSIPPEHNGVDTDWTQCGWSTEKQETEEQAFTLNLGPDESQWAVELPPPAAWSPEVPNLIREAPPVAEVPQLASLVPSPHETWLRAELTHGVPVPHWEHLWLLGSPSQEMDELHREPQLVPWQVIRGIEPPKAAGYHLPFQLREGVNPFVPWPRTFLAQGLTAQNMAAWTEADPSLRYCRIPLRSESFSYDLWRRAVAGATTEWPEAKATRVEEFLAGVTYSFPAPESKESLRLTLSGGVSPFAASGTFRENGKQVQLPSLPLMMQVGVQARPELEGWRQACRLTVLVDRSRSMLRGGRLGMARQALAELIENMGPADRLSLVAFDQTAEVLIEDAVVEDQTEKEELISILPYLRAKSSTNLLEGLRAAYALASNYPRTDHLEHRLILLTDGIEMDDRLQQQVEKSVVASQADGLKLSVIDLSDGQWLNPRLLRLAESGGGRLHHAKSVEQIRWGLLETLTGRSQVVARQVTLKVEFNPEAVAAYRLLGHEANDLDRLSGAPLEVTFHAGQQATALFEIAPRGVDQPLATVELRWRNAWGEEQRQVQTIRPSQCPLRFEDSEVSLQRACVVAEAAEILRESPFVGTAPRTPGGNLGAVLDYAGRTGRDTTGEASYHHFVKFVEQLIAQRKNHR